MRTVSQRLRASIVFGICVGAGSGLSLSIMHLLEGRPDPSALASATVLNVETDDLNRFEELLVEPVVSQQTEIPVDQLEYEVTLMERKRDRGADKLLETYLFIPENFSQQIFSLSFPDSLKGERFLVQVKLNKLNQSQASAIESFDFKLLGINSEALISGRVMLEPFRESLARNRASLSLFAQGLITGVIACLVAACLMYPVLLHVELRDQKRMEALDS